MISLALIAAVSGVLPPQATPVRTSSLQQATETILCGGATQGSDPQLFTSENLGGGSATNYCQATVNSFGTTCNISYVGSLNLADATFGLVATGAAPIPNSWGMFTYGPVQTNVPFANGFLCISPFGPGISRMNTQHLGTGTVMLSIASQPTEFVQFVPGSTWNYQFWYRDPPAQGAYFNLSDGLHVTFAP